MPTPRYFSPVEGHKVNRFGTMTQNTSNELFGCKVDSASGSLVWDTKAVLMISGAEAARFRREYDRLVRDGALVERSEEDRKAYLARLGEENAAAKKKASAPPDQPEEAPAPVAVGKAPKTTKTPA